MGAAADRGNSLFLTPGWELKELEPLLPQFEWLTSTPPGGSEVSGLDCSSEYFGRD